MKKLELEMFSNIVDNDDIQESEECIVCYIFTKALVSNGHTKFCEKYRVNVQCVVQEIIYVIFDLYSYHAISFICLE